MRAFIEVVIDTDLGVCTIQERGAEMVVYDFPPGSLESIANYSGQALSDYLQGFEEVLYENAKKRGC